MIMALLSVAALQGCNDDDITVRDARYTRPINAALPVATLTSSCQDLFNRLAKKNNIEFIIEEDGLISSRYHREYTYTWEDILHLDSVYCSMNEPLEINKDYTIKQTITGHSRLNTVEGQRLDSIFVKSAVMNIVSPPLDLPGKAVLTIPELRDKSGKAFSANWKLVMGYDLHENIDGYAMYPTNTADSCNLTLIVNIESNSKPDAAPDPHFVLDFNIDKLVPTTAYGYFGNYIMSANREKQTFDIFDESDVPMEVEFTGCTTTLDVANYAGTQFNVTLEDMNYYNEEDNKTRKLYFMRDNTLFIDQKNVKDFFKNKEFEPEHNYYVLDSTNSNIDYVMAIHPNLSDYILKVEVNPLGENQTNFITDEKKLFASVDEYIPLWVRIQHLERRDTVDLDLKEVLDDENVDLVDEVTITLKIDNAMPVRIYEQGYFCTETKAVDSLYDKPRIICHAPKLDSKTNRIKESAYNEEVITLTHDQVKRYYDEGVIALYLITNATTEDYGDVFVKCYENYGFKVKCSVDVKSKNSDD